MENPSTEAKQSLSLRFQVVLRVELAGEPYLAEVPKANPTRRRARSRKLDS